MFEAVQKFGLAHFDFPTMLSNISFFLRAISLNIDPRNHKQIPLWYTALDIVFASGYCYVYLLSMIWFVFWRSAETGDVLAALIIFSLGVSSEIGPYKVIFMFIYKNKLRKVMEQCLANNAIIEPDSRFSINLARALRVVKRRAIVFWSFIVGNGILYALKPIILPGRHLMEDIFIFFGLDPIFETPNYQIAFFLTILGICVSVYLPSNATAVQIMANGYIEAQMLAWSEELVHLWEDAEQHYSKLQSTLTDNTGHDPNGFIKQRHIITNEFVTIRLKAIVKAHAENLDLLSKVEMIFRGAVAIEFILLIVCLIAELLGGLQNTYMEVPYALVQVGMDCLIGQRLADASLVYENAVYYCNWENFNKNNMRTVMTMMVMAQKTMTLSAGGVTTLNYLSFLAIIKMIYSMYTTLSAAIN